LNILDAVPVIRDLQQSMEAMRQAELRKLDGRRVGFTDDQWQAVETLTRGMMNKFLHPALLASKAAAAEGDAAKLEVLRVTFDKQRAAAYSAAHAPARSKRPDDEEQVAAFETGPEEAP
jgi:glutamyl-tRNA reductase